MVCFVHVDFENVLRATTACTFSTSQLPKVVREWCVLLHFDFEMCFHATTACTFSTSQLPKVVREWCVLYILTSKCASRHNGVHFSTSQLPKVVREWCVLYMLTSKCASRHNGVHFFNISTSKSGPRMVCFVHFDFEMCFTPTMACTFSTSQLPKMVRAPSVFNILTSKCASRHNGVHFFDIATSKSGPILSGVLCILTWKCALRHNGVQFFISHLASWLRTRRFSEPTFRPSAAPNHWKNTVFRDFPTFSRFRCIFFLLTLSLLPFFLLIFLFSLPRFSSVHIVGSLTSKLPSNILLRFPKNIGVPPVIIHL